MTSLSKYLTRLFGNPKDIAKLKIEQVELPKVKKPTKMPKVKKPKPGPKEMKRLGLVIHIKTNSGYLNPHTLWVDEEKDSKSTISSIFKGFIKWYFGRKESESYMMRHKEGADEIRRATIDHISYINKIVKEGDSL